MQNMPKSAYMALAKSVGYPTEGEGRKEKLDPFVDLSILIPYHIQQLLELKELALKLAGGDAALSFRLWEVTRRELKIKKVRDISKFKEA